MGKSPSGKEGHFLKIALNLDLTLPDDGECPALLISCGIIDLLKRFVYFGEESRSL